MICNETFLTFRQNEHLRQTNKNSTYTTKRKYRKRYILQNTTFIKHFHSYLQKTMTKNDIFSTLTFSSKVTGW